MYIFNIQRFSTHDGPGIRTTVFFKGCPLRCRWCHNPESQSFTPEILHNPERCVLCGRCLSGCPAGAISIRDGKIVTDNKKCTGCRLCVDECLNCARELAGTQYSAAQIIDVVRRDKTFYGESGGGVTFSGGECLCCSDELAELLRSCRRLGIHTAVDTCGAVSWGDIEKVLPDTCLWLYDVKCVNPQKHKSFTGADNRIILENLHRLKESGANIWLRLPLIAGVNDTQGDMAAALELAKDIRPERVSLLAYHDTGNFKYTRLGREAESFASPSKERIEEIRALFESEGFEVKIGG